MPHHKRKRPKQARAGSLLSRPSKLSTHRTADRMKARRRWQRHWRDDLSDAELAALR